MLINTNVQTLKKEIKEKFNMFQHLSPDYQETVVKRWDKLLNEGDAITSDSARVATALVLENTERAFRESYSGAISSVGGLGAQHGATPGGSPGGGGALGTTNTYGAGDSRLPTIVIPTVRRIFPELIAHDIVGVQPMNGPVGFAFAMRFQYGANAGGGTVTDHQGDEMGYNTVHSDHVGASGLVELDDSANFGQTVPGVGATTQANDYWQRFAGGTAGTYNGMGANLNQSEWWKIGEDMPMSQFRLEKGIVEAKSRKLATHWSLELGEDMSTMHGIDVDAEMVDVMSYEIKAEIDRQLIGEMIKAAIVGDATSPGKYLSDWTPVSADGRNQLERIGTIYTQVLLKSQQIAINTRRGPATFAITTPNVTAFLERLGQFALDNSAVKVSGENVGVAKVGSMRNGGITVYRDTLAQGDYILLGFKGKSNYDSGVIYCPYIPLQVNRAVGNQDFSPRIGLRTRYGVLAQLFGSANYYQMIGVSGLTGILNADGGRVFSF